jgi:hypothetical protein
MGTSSVLRVASAQLDEVKTRRLAIIPKTAPLIDMQKATDPRRAALC